MSTELRRLLQVYACKLGQDAIEGVEHYLEHDELEMAFEGLCLELMKLSDFAPEDREVCRALSRRLGLDRESVFDAGFWRKLHQEPPGSPL